MTTFPEEDPSLEASEDSVASIGAVRFDGLTPAAFEELRGMAVEGGTLVRAFDAVGWGWDGRWSSPIDYQHFSARGR